MSETLLALRYGPRKPPVPLALDSYPTGMDVPQLQRVPDSMFQFGLTPGAKAPYRITAMIQPEPGLVG